MSMFVCNCHQLTNGRIAKKEDGDARSWRGSSVPPNQVKSSVHCILVETYLFSLSFFLFRYSSVFLVTCVGRPLVELNIMIIDSRRMTRNETMCYRMMDTVRLEMMI